MKPVTQKRWRYRDHDGAVLAGLLSGEVTGLTPVVAAVLATRGIRDPGGANDFLKPSMGKMHDPFLLLGMERGATRLAEARERGEKVCVYGDYDVDGITSVTLLVDFFRAVGIDVTYYIPHRQEDGYGLSREGLDRAAAAGAKVVVTVDCGITAVDEAGYASTLGLDLIITDHHTPPAELPPALAVINPLQPGCPFPFKQLAGVGIAFNLAAAVRKTLREQGCFADRAEPNLRSSLDLVALGTIADVVPLVDENRIFVKYGLRELTVGARTGVRALKKVAGIDGDVGCGAVGFRLAPRLNAAGRLDDAAPGVELLLTRDEAQAEALAGELDAGNRERQLLEEEILRDALAMVQGKTAFAERTSIVLASEAWHPGVIGIVASRLVDLFHRPTVLIALKEGEGRGSGRSIANFHLHDALTSCSQHLLRFGGHKHAAGLSIEESTLDDFVTTFDEVAAGLLSPEDLLPELLIDRALVPEEITADLASALESLAPFGMGNPEPVFVLPAAKVVERRILKDKHLKLWVEAGGRRFETIGYNMAGREPLTVVDLAFSLQMNEWKGRRTLQLRLKDLRAPAQGLVGEGG